MSRNNTKLKIRLKLARNYASEGHKTIKILNFKYKKQVRWCKVLKEKNNSLWKLQTQQKQKIKDLQRAWEGMAKDRNHYFYKAESFTNMPFWKRVKFLFGRV